VATRHVDTRIWGWVWLGPIGRLLFRLARVSIRATFLPPPATHRATELALGMAAAQLFEDLPRHTRRQLRDLPDVVHRLEGDAQQLRRRLDDLQDALGDGGPGSGGASAPPTPGADAAADRIVAALKRERDLVQRRFSEAVKALETIRLNLLRLHAGSGSVQSLTTDLGLAREVAAEIGRQLAAQQEIDEALR
jgi:serine/threonine-protein kinase